MSRKRALSKPKSITVSEKEPLLPDLESPPILEGRQSHFEQSNKKKTQNFMWILAFLLLGSLAVAGLTVFRQKIDNSMPGNKDPFLDRDILPDQVKPSHYTLELQPDFATFTFTGKAGIKYAHIPYLLPIGRFLANSFRLLFM